MARWTVLGDWIVELVFYHGCTRLLIDGLISVECWQYELEKYADADNGESCRRLV